MVKSLCGIWPGPEKGSRAGTYDTLLSAIPQESLCHRRFLPSPQPSPCKGEGGEGASLQPSPCKGEGGEGASPRPSHCKGEGASLCTCAIEPDPPIWVRLLLSSF